MPARFARFCFALISIALLAACAPAVAPAPSIDPGRVAKLEQARADFDQRLQQLQDNLVLLEARVADQQKTLDQMHQELVAEKGTRAGQIASPPPTQPAVAAPAPATAPQPAATEVYLQAFADYAAGRYQQAVTGFSRFLEVYSASDYAGNAQYWLAECYLGMKQYDLAAKAFAQTADRYPENAKAAEALFKLAETQKLLGQPERAADTMNRLQSRYPDSAAAKKSLSAP